VSDRLSFRVLGPLEVERGGTLQHVGGPKTHTLLEMLLLRRGEPISVDGLIDAI
jgi:DNA-binding SARP family transcriptional activator